MIRIQWAAVRGEIALGKFFDAMQRAAEAESAPETKPPVRVLTQPELDETLLRPEEPEATTRSAVESPQPQARRLHHDSSGAAPVVLRALESEDCPAQDPSPRNPEPMLAVPRVRVQAIDRQPVVMPKLGTQPIHPVDAFREPVPTTVRVHPAYDRIVQRLLTYRRTPRQGVILVTSAIGQEGTSTVARNIATALGQGGSERVLLVDANLRTPSQHTAFDLDRSGGFSEVLQGALSLASAVKDENIGSGIALMTSGAPVKSPSQILKATTVQGAMTALQTLYDWIILDCPPATIYPDVASLGTACGGAILVVRAESTRSEVAEEARGILEGTGTDVLGAVLNRRRFHIPQYIYKHL